MSVFQRRFQGLDILVTVLVLVLLLPANSKAQNNFLVRLVNSVDTLHKVLPTEKLYLHLDKPYYAAGDTIWFKAYLFNGSYLIPSQQSGLFYLEMVNDSNKVIRRMMLPVSAGLSWGDIPLDPTDFAEGGYTLRAYTNWMRNFGDAYAYQQRVFIGGSYTGHWLVNSNINISGEGKAQLHLQFKQANKEPLMLKPIQLQVNNGSKILYLQKQETRLDGNIDITIPYNNQAKKLLVTAGDDSQRFTFPVILDRADIDLQFMPEAGDMIAGLPAHIAFKAIGEDGLSREVSGRIYDSKQQLVVSFSSEHKGMGSFELLPVANETYSARLDMPGEITKIYHLPIVKPTGTTIRVNERNEADSITVTILGTGLSHYQYYLIGQSRNVVCFAAAIDLASGYSRFKIAKNLFPTGIARLTLLDSANHPQNERMVFIDHKDMLHFSIKTNKQIYAQRDSVALDVHVSDSNGDPVKGSFSLAVTDNTQVKQDSTGSNIYNYLLLNSDLKGEIEQPGYYFQRGDEANRLKQLDNLLLTHGWVGYNWDQLSGPLRKPAFKAEQQFEVTGRVSNVFNKPVAGTHVLLLSKKPSFLLDTLTGKDGRFTFDNILPLDTPAYVVQARNRHGKSFNVGLQVDEFNPLTFTHQSAPMKPWYLSNDTIVNNYINTNSKHQQRLTDFTGPGLTLKGVTVKAKKIIKGSKNLNGPGNADQIIDELELEKAGKKTLLEVLTQKINGFRPGVLVMADVVYSPTQAHNYVVATFLGEETDPEKLKPKSVGVIDWYYIQSKPVKFMIDGIATAMFIGSPIDEQNFYQLKNYLQSVNAEDIKGIEVNNTTKYNSRYIPTQWAMSINSWDFTVIEITTRAGHGPVIANTPGVFLYKPLPFSLPKEYYRPKYIAKNTNGSEPDMRSTLHWIPDLMTDSNGNAKVSFYSSDSNAPYSVNIQGSDMNGNIGAALIKINSKINLR